MFGAVHTWAITVMTVAAMVAFLSWLLKMAMGGELRWFRTPLNLPILIITAFLLFQVIPLPPRVLQKISPEAARTYSETIPGYRAILKMNQLSLSYPEENEMDKELYDTSRTLSIYKGATWNELKLIFVYMAALLVFMNNISSRRQLRRLVMVVVAVGFSLALLGILQELSSAKGIYWFWRTPSWEGRTPGFFGSFVNRNNFASYMTMAVPLALGLLWGIRGHDSLRKQKAEGNSSEPMEESAAGFQKSLVGFFAFIMIIALFMSLSRGGMLSFLFAMLVMALVMVARRRVRGRGKTAWLIAPVTIAALVIISSPTVYERLSTLADLEEDYSAIYRLDVWKDTLSIIQDNPLLGTGLGTFQYIFPKYRVNSATNQFYWDHAHNDYLETWSDIGLIVLLLCLWAVYRLFKDVLFCHILGLVRGVAHRHKGNKSHRRRDASAVALTLGALGGITAIFIHSIVDFNLRIPSNALLFTLLVGIAIVAIHMKHDPEGDYVNMRQIVVRFPRWVSCVLSPALIALGVYMVLWPITGPLRAELAFKKALSVRSQNTAGDDTGLKLLAKAAALEPKNAEYRARLGEYHRRMMVRHWGKDRYKYAYHREQAEKTFKSAINLNPTKSIYHTMQGWVQDDFQRIEAAVREFSLGVKYDPTSAYAHWAYGNWAMKTASRDITFLDTGIQEYKKAISIRPAIAREALRQYSGFARSYDELKEIIPPIKEAHKELALFLQQENVWEKNRQEFKKHMREADNSIVYYLTQAQMDYGKGKYKEAVENLLELIEIDGNQAEAHFWLANYTNQRGKELGHDWEFSKNHFLEAIRLEPARMFYRQWYAWALYYRGENKEAAEQLTMVLRRDNSAFVYFMLGRVYRAMGEFDKAIIKYQQALEKDPKNIQFMMWLGTTYYDDGKYHKAREQFSRVLELEPSNSEALGYLKKIERDTKGYLSQRQK